MGLSLALREWSAVIDAFGHGKQIFMVRRYPPKHASFFLYPTFSYYTSTINKPGTLAAKFQPQYLDLARNSAEQTFERAQKCFVDFKYYAELDDISTLEDPKICERL